MLDHGILNIPLSKRGDIDAQLDKYKAEKTKNEKRKSEDLKFLRNLDRTLALNEFDSLTDAQIKNFATRANITLKDARIELKAMCVNPAKAIRVFTALKELTV